MRKSEISVIRKLCNDLADSWLRAAGQLANKDEFRKDEHDRARETTFRNCVIDLNRLRDELTGQ